MAERPVTLVAQTPLPQAYSSVNAAPMAPTEASDGPSLKDVWRTLRRRQRLVLVVAGLVASISFSSTLVKRFTAPVYSGDFRLLISDPISSSGSGDGLEPSLAGGVVESLARNRTSVDIPTLIQTLSSPLVLDPVRRELGAAAPLLGSLTITQGGDRRQSGLVQGVLLISLKGEVPAQLKRSLDALSTAFLNFALAQRQERLSQGLQYLDKQEPLLEAKVNRLQADLARFRRRHNLLEPEAEAKALKSETIGMELQQRQLAADRARLLKLRQDIASGQLTAANFASTGSSSGGSASSSAGASADGISVTQARSDLLDQLQSVEQQLAQTRSVYRSDSPRVQSLVALRNRLAEQRRDQQLQAVDTALSLNTTRSQTLRQQIDGIEGQFQLQPGLIKEYEELRQRLTVAQNNLVNFLSTRSTFQLEQAQNTTPWKVISPADVMGYPEEPNLRRGLMQALLLGAAAGIGAGLLRDRLDHVFHNPGEVQQDTNEPLLGHVPHVSFFKGVRENNRFLLAELDGKQSAAAEPASNGTSPAGSPSISGYNRFFYQEAFRNLFTSLRFLTSDHPLRSVALTSSMPAEGKTLVNVLLAKTLSEMGQRVLLVDADMRKPQMHYRIGLNNLTGLSNVLTEPDLHWSEAIQTVAGYDGWSVLTAGRRPPDPTRLLSSAHMADLVRELADSGQFDLVLYDTPPVLGLADAALVAQHIDGVILLVSLDRVDRGLPPEAAARIRSSGATLLGLVTNAVREEEHQRSGYGYGYGRYGYGGYGGYGAYDPRNTYAYLNEGEDAGEATGTADPSIHGQKPLGRLQAATNRLRRWIDG